MGNIHLSVVTTLYFSEPYIYEFYQRICQETDKLTPDYEIIFVNDGSPDHAVELAKQLADRDPKVRVVDLSRNFGHHKAMMTGLMYTKGELVFLIDVDLEEPPELLSYFYQTYQDNDVDVVYGVQAQRQGSWLNQIGGDLYYWLFNFLSDYPLSPNPLTARLMSRRYVRQLLRYKENLFSIEGLWEATGFNQLAVPTQKSTYKGSTTYSLSKKVAYVVNAITAFSNKPLIYISYLGLFIVTICVIYILYLLFGYLFLGMGIPGWTSLIISIWFLGGLVILILGIISVYISVIFVEIKKRPYSIVRQVYAKPIVKELDIE